MNLATPFKSAGHFLAKAYTVVVKALPKIQATETTIETVTATVNPQAVLIEKGAYAALGELAALLHVGGDAAAAKLQDAGLDINVINTVKGLLGSIEQFTKLL